MEPPNPAPTNAKPLLGRRVRSEKALAPIQTVFAPDAHPHSPLSESLNSRGEERSDVDARPKDRTLREQPPKSAISRLFSRSPRPTLGVRSQTTTSRFQHGSPTTTERPLTGSTVGSSRTTSHSTPASTPRSPFSPNPDVPRLRSKPSRPVLEQPSSNGHAKASTFKQCWRPPPLFQAYPQAIIHCTIQSPVVTAEAILRLYQEDGTKDLKHDMLSAPEGLNTDSDLPEKGKKERLRSNKKIIRFVSKMNWAQKVFVLVTSGYLLQYSGEGVFDRLPEKVMKIDQNCVAFASDVLPGKPWVLQVSHVANADGSLTPKGKTVAKKSFWSALSRKQVVNVLLVLTGAQEMNDWMRAIRDEIEFAGGKGRNSATDIKADHDPPKQTLQHRPSHRFVIQRDPNPSSALQSPSVSETTTYHADAETKEISHQNEGSVPSIVTSHLTGSTAVSERQLRPEQLQDRSHESTSSSPSSMASYDTRETQFPIKLKLDGLPEIPAVSPFVASEQWDATHKQSMRVSSETSDRGLLSTAGSRLSFVEPSSPHSMTHSARSGTPSIRNASTVVRNFSVPTSSKRFSILMPSPTSDTAPQSSIEVPVDEREEQPFLGESPLLPPSNTPDRGRTPTFNYPNTQNLHHKKISTESCDPLLDDLSFSEASLSPTESPRSARFTQIPEPSRAPPRTPPPVPLEPASTRPLPALPPPSPPISVTSSPRAPSLRRPVSMLLQSPTIPIDDQFSTWRTSHSPSQIQHPPRSSSYFPAISFATPATVVGGTQDVSNTDTTAVRRLSVRPTVKLVSHRKSMPAIAAYRKAEILPPPAFPPPTCPLPRLPPQKTA
ncbi:MAG: hypothetical protein M4579_001697 [Chaenotheca gracillima]|nr:MAG: hypothetical protein M4579_001697 [Chaenotheca gracillima]